MAKPFDPPPPSSPGARAPGSTSVDAVRAAPVDSAAPRSHGNAPLPPLLFLGARTPSVHSLGRSAPGVAAPRSPAPVGVAPAPAHRAAARQPLPASVAMLDTSELATLLVSNAAKGPQDLSIDLPSADLPSADLPSAEELLRAPTAIERILAADELLARGQRPAPGALAAALADITDPAHPLARSAGPLLVALARLRPEGACEVALETLRRLAPERAVVEAGSAALVAFGATSAVPALRDLLREPRVAHVPEPLARALVALGGAAEADLFVELATPMRHPLAPVALEALGRLRHRPAQLLLEARAASQWVPARLAALGALVRMDAPGAAAKLLGELARQERGHLSRVVDAVCSAEVGAAGPLLLRALPATGGAPPGRWSPPQLDAALTLLAGAVRLGVPGAAARVQELRDDGDLSPCARARAAAVLVDDELARQVTAVNSRAAISCVAYLLPQEPPGLVDPRDDDARRQRTELAVLDALERFGLAHWNIRPVLGAAVLELIDRAPPPPDEPLARRVFERACQVLWRLTGIEVELR